MIRFLVLFLPLAVAFVFAAGTDYLFCPFGLYPPGGPCLALWGFESLSVVLALAVLMAFLVSIILYYPLSFFLDLVKMVRGI